MRLGRSAGVKKRHKNSPAIAFPRGIIRGSRPIIATAFFQGAGQSFVPGARNGTIRGQDKFSAGPLDRLNRTGPPGGFWAFQRQTATGGWGKIGTHSKGTAPREPPKWAFSRPATVFPQSVGHVRAGGFGRPIPLDGERRGHGFAIPANRPIPGGPGSPKKKHPPWPPFPAAARARGGALGKTKNPSISDPPGAVRFSRLLFLFWTLAGGTFRRGRGRQGGNRRFRRVAPRADGKIQTGWKSSGQRDGGPHHPTISTP